VLAPGGGLRFANPPYALKRDKQKRDRFIAASRHFSLLADQVERAIRGPATG
jgi:hypothetical protein